jgi:LGFP repeat
MTSHFVLPKRVGVILNPVNPTIFDIAMKPFRDKHDQLHGAPGEPLSKGLPENNGSGSRVRYQNGTIYQRADGTCSWVYGLIGERYDQLGAGVSWLGMPVSDEVDFSEGGRASRFENGSIYFWPDTGAIDMNQVVVHYTGMYAFAETDSDRFGTTSDEPYVLLGVITPSLSLAAVQSQIYDDVDAGDSRPDLIELYRGMPEGIAISVLLMEHDEGDPEKYKAAVTAGVVAGAGALAAAMAAIPVVGPFLAPVAAGFFSSIAPDVISAVNDLIGAGDDVLGNTVLQLTAKQMVVLAARTVNQDQWGIGWKAVTESLTGQGSEYKVYFGLVAV